MTSRYLRLKLAGLCVSCEAGLQEDDGVHCVECVERRAHWAASAAGKASTSATARRYTQTPAGAEYRRAAQARRRARRRAARQCIACCTPVEDRLHCLACAAVHLARVVRSRDRKTGAPIESTDKRRATH
jgi:hypothetical protein